MFQRVHMHNVHRILDRPQLPNSRQAYCAAPPRLQCTPQMPCGSQRNGNKKEGVVCYENTYLLLKNLYVYMRHCFKSIMLCCAVMCVCVCVCD